jgi:Na+/melibiose symporter-like transporter
MVKKLRQPVEIAVPVCYAGKSIMPNESAPDFRRGDYVKITILGFAVTALWQSLHTIILPMRLLDFVPEAHKNTYLGLMTLVGLLLAMVIQPIAGAFSDRTGVKWGRRRPFILWGIIIALLVLPGIGLAGSFAVLFVVYCLLQAAGNTAQGPYQAFIPEYVPEDRRGTASGVKSLFEVIGGVLFVYITGIFMDRYAPPAGRSWLWLSLGILGALLLITMLATIFLVKEKPAVREKPNFSPFKEFASTIKEAAGNRDIVWFLLSRLLVYMAFTTIQQFALYYLRDVLNVTDAAKATARFTIFAVIGLLVTAWPAGHFSDKIGRKPLSAGAGILGAAGIVIILLGRSYNATLGAAVLIGMAIGAFNSANWALATDLVPKGREARYLGIANMATTGGAALARAIGPLIDFFNNRAPLSGYNVMLLFCIAYFVIGAGLVFKVRGKPALKPVR